jgi:Domain of unknown function (DUF1998)
MTRAAQRTRPRVGELRPSQLLQSFGVGSVVDLPHLSVIVMGLDDWNTSYAEAVTEERLLAAVRHHLGHQVAGLRTPPYLPETSNPFDEWTQVGVPVAVFPRWLRCPRCFLLAPIASGLFTLKAEVVRTDRTRYVHTNCSGRGRAPDVLAARFLLACPAGHLDDFPWVEFVHAGGSCLGPVLDLREIGVSGQAADVLVRCRTCDTSRVMAQAFGEEARARLPRCRGRHPHLASFTPGCEQPVRTILLGASNAWFGARLSVLSIPVAAGPLAQKVAEHWADLQRVTSPEVLAFARGEPRYATFATYTDEALWAAIEAHRTADGQATEGPADLLGPEWAAFTGPETAPTSDDFQLRPKAPPPRFASRIQQVVLAERLREVQALVGFTRIDAPDEPRQRGQDHPWAPLARTDPLWVPCAEVRGEGIFLRLAEAPLAAWERRADRSDRASSFATAAARWRYDRGLPDAPWPGMRFALLHSLAHMLIREFALECGYGAAGLAERLYAEETEQGRMAGLLLYTSAPDSEGTLGGLVELGDPDRLGQLLAQALEHARLCSSDPLCAEHEPDARALHGAACHACLFAAETSCEVGNRFLDRTLLVDTLGPAGLAYFGP